MRMNKDCTARDTHHKRAQNQKYAFLNWTAITCRNCVKNETTPTKTNSTQTPLIWFFWFSSSRMEKVFEKK